MTSPVDTSRSLRHIRVVASRKRRVLPEGRFVTRGGRKLGAWLKTVGVGMTEFAANAGVNRITLYQVIHGERWKYITVDFALKVSLASDGIVCVQDFASATATAEDGPIRRRRTGTDG